MTHPNLTPEHDVDETPTRVILPVAGGRRSRAELYSLVLLAVNINHRVIKGPRGWRLEVGVDDLAQARHHLQRFEEENRDWPAPPREFTLETDQGWWVAVLLTGLLLLHLLTGSWAEGSLWFQRGAVDGRLVLEGGQWWRVVTGLTLHADAGHLLGNLTLGGLAIAYLAGRSGGGAAWALTLFTGSLGNYCNALAQGASHRFIGFSTAVFGVIGCLCGIRMAEERGLRPALLPLGAGLGLLAMLGTEGVKTDVGAHLWGLGTGMATGLLWQLTMAKAGPRSPLRQTGLATASLLLVVVCWFLALR